jgi:hypothetical protein
LYFTIAGLRRLSIPVAVSPSRVPSQLLPGWRLA